MCAIKAINGQCASFRSIKSFYNRFFPCCNRLRTGKNNKMWTRNAYKVGNAMASIIRSSILFGFLSYISFSNNHVNRTPAPAQSVEGKMRPIHFAHAGTRDAFVYLLATTATNRHRTELSQKIKANERPEVHMVRRAWSGNPAHIVQIHAIVFSPACTDDGRQKPTTSLFFSATTLGAETVKWLNCQQIESNALVFVGQSMRLPVAFSGHF